MQCLQCIPSVQWRCLKIRGMGFSASLLPNTDLSSCNKLTGKECSSLTTCWSYNLKCSHVMISF